MTPKTILLSAAALFFAGCTDSEASHAADSATLSGQVVLTGSSTIAPLVAAAAERFEAVHPGVRIDVQSGGSSRGIADAGRKLADIGMTSRALKPGEGTELTQHLLANDGVGFVVHSSNPVQRLTKQQALDIYTGAIKSWSDLGGLSKPIVVINRPAGRSELDLTAKYFDIEAGDMVADVIGGENQQAVKLIAGNPDAIAYLSLGTAHFEIAAGTELKLLDLDGVAATPAAVASGSYPLARPLILVTNGELEQGAQAFLNELLSPASDDLIREQSFVIPTR